MGFLPSLHPNNCQKCDLCKTRKNVVHSVLPEGAKVLFIGEGPGKNEDLTGEPFQGEAGKKLDDTLYYAGIDRFSCGVANTVACRPPDNRNPVKKEMTACFEFLDAEIRSLKPELIVLLGAVPVSLLLPGQGTLKSIHGNFYVSEEYGCKIVPTYHPAYALYEPARRIDMNQDMLKVSQFLKGEAAQKKKPTKYYVVKTKKQFDWLIENLSEQELWAFDVETTGLDFLTSEVFILTFSWKECTAVLVDTRLDFCKENRDYVWSNLKTVLENNSKKILQNGAFDIKSIRKYGIVLNNFYADTLHMHHLLDENKSHGLEALTWEFTDKGGYDIELMQYVKKNGIIVKGSGKSYADIPIDMIHEYALSDADVTFRCYNMMLPKIYEEGLDFTLFNITMPEQRMLLETEYIGVTVDVQHVEEAIVKFSKQIEEYGQKVLAAPEVQRYIVFKSDQLREKWKVKYEASKNLKSRYSSFDEYFLSKKEKDRIFKFNPDSPLQLRELLIDHMKLKVVKYTKRKKKVREEDKNPSIDASVLEVYSRKNKFCAYLSSQRKFLKLKSTFLDGVKERLGIDGRLHTQYLVSGTVTGRPSSRNPNLNNIPRTATSADIKDIYTSDKSGDWLVECDGKAMEFRMWASMSQDERMIRDITLGLDIHKVMAGIAFYKRSLPPRGDITPEMFAELVKDVTKDQRQLAKTEVVFGPMYDRGPKAMAASLDISQKEATRVRGELFKRYKIAERYLSRLKARCRGDKFVRGVFGRKRRPLDIRATSFKIRSEAERQAINSPIQGSASDVVMLAGLRIYDYIKEKSIDARLVLTVYDSMIYNVAGKALESFVKYIDTEFIRPLPELHVPLGVEIKIGKRWGSLIEVDTSKLWIEEFARVRKELNI